MSIDAEDLKRGVAERLARVFAEAGERTAYFDEDGELTYGELERESGRLARFLIANLGPAERGSQQAVHLLLPHNRWVPVAVVAVERSGHFYLAMEAFQGLESLQKVVADCPARVLLTTSDLLSLARQLEAPGVTIVNLEDFGDEPDGELPATSPDHIYGVVYTSGSTGEPRGIPRTQGQQLFSALKMSQLGGYEGGRVAWVTSYSHGFSGLSLWGPLLTGCTVAGRTIGKMSALALGEWLRDREITLLSCPPGVLRSLGTCDGLAPLPAVQAVHTGLEPLTRSDIESVTRRLRPGTRIIQYFSSTEAGTMATFVHTVGSPWNGDVSPAGVVEPYLKLSLIGPDGEEVPAGETGEIVVSGPYVSTGYWNRPAETAAKFSPDPLVPNATICRTGDLGRINADGMLEHRGRVDFMLKIRGFRVEPVTIERALLSHPHVAEVVVTSFRGSSANARLVAYCVTRLGAHVSAGALQSHLEGSLPPYLVPARFVFLDALPLNAVGKLDRKALPPPGRRRPDLGIAFVAPQDETEQALADLWCQVLDLDEVGTKDDFFRLGGDSLSALDMLAAAETRLGLRAVEGFYEIPTIEGLLGAARATASTDTAVPTAFQLDRAAGWLWRYLYRLASVVGAGRFVYFCQVLTAHVLAWFWVTKKGRWFSPARLRRRLSRLLFRHENSRRVGRHSAVADTGIEVWGQHWQFLNGLDVVRLVRLKGVPRVEALRKAGRGIIFVQLHGAHTALSRVLFTALGVTPLGVFPPKPDPERRWETGAANTRILRQAEDELVQGGTVRIYPDGKKGTTFTEVSLFGQRLPFLLSFADLAVRTGAAVVPLGVHSDWWGRVTLEVGEAFTTAAEGDPVATLQRQYLSFLENTWRRSPHLIYRSLGRIVFAALWGVDRKVNLH